MMDSVVLGFVSVVDVSQSIELARWPPDPPAPALEALWTIKRADGIKVSSRLFMRGQWGYEARRYREIELMGQLLGAHVNPVDFQHERSA